jgi:hypothetical protein
MRLTNASPILFSILVSPTVVLYFHEWKRKGTRRWDVRSDEELVLNIDKVFRQLDGYYRQYSQRKFKDELDL